MQNINLENLENKVLNLFIEFDTEELQLEDLSDLISPYEILMLICFIGDMKSINFKIGNTSDTYLYHYEDKTYKIPGIKIIRKE